MSEARVFPRELHERRARLIGDKSRYKAEMQSAGHIVWALERARSKLKAGWTQSVDACTATGVMCVPDDKAAVAWSYFGAMIAGGVKPNETVGAMRKLAEAIGLSVTASGYAEGVWHWSNKTGRKHVEIMAILNRAIADAERCRKIANGVFATAELALGEFEAKVREGAWISE